MSKCLRKKGQQSDRTAPFRDVSHRTAPRAACGQLTVFPEMNMSRSINAAVLLRRNIRHSPRGAAGALDRFQSGIAAHSAILAAKQPLAWRLLMSRQEPTDELDVDEQPGVVGQEDPQRDPHVRDVRGAVLDIVNETRIVDVGIPQHHSTAPRPPPPSHPG